MNVKTLGIDLAKIVFQVHGVDSAGHTVVKRQLRRRQVLLFMAQLQPCLVDWKRVGAPTTERS
jgi:transposase